MRSVMRDLSSKDWLRRSRFFHIELLKYAMSSSTDLSTVNLESLSMQDLEGLCHKYNLRVYGLKSQLLVRLRTHHTSLALSSSSHDDSTLPASDEPGLSTIAATSTPLPPRQNCSTEASVFTPEQQAHIKHLIASHMASAGTTAAPSNSPSVFQPTAANASRPTTTTHGGVGELFIIAHTLLVHFP